MQFCVIANNLISDETVGFLVFVYFFWLAITSCVLPAVRLVCLIVERGNRMVDNHCLTKKP